MSMSNSRRRLLKISTCFAAVLAVAANSSAFAQTVEATEEVEQAKAGGGTVYSTITVTARKVEESLLEVPIAITAFDENAIEDLALTSITDLPDLTPGFVYEAFAGLPGRFDNSPRFRGVSINTSSPTRQTASVFVDGVFVAGGVQGIQLDDVARVEIIKGPQSAYFGRNTFGGAINYITKTPGDEFAADVNVDVATRNFHALSASVEGPLIGDVLKGRLSGTFRNKDGHFKSSNDGTRLGDEETWSIAGTLFFEPNDDFSAKVRVNYFENEDGAPAYSFSGKNEHNCGPFSTDGVTGTDTTICGIASVNPPGLNTDVPDALKVKLADLIGLNGPNRDTMGLDRQNLRVSAQFDWDIPGTNITLSSLTGYNDEEVNLLRDADDTTDLAFVSFSGRHFEDISQELRLSGFLFNDRLTWNVGANYFDQKFTNNGDFIVPALGYFAFSEGEPAQEKIKTLGIFGSLDFKVTDQLSVSIEGRQQKDEITEDSDITDAIAGKTGEFKNFLPRATLNYQATPDTLFYGQYSEGNLPGGFNTAYDNLSPTLLAGLLAIEPNASPNFDEEKLTNYELGWKQTLQDGRGYFAVAAFQMERTGQTVRKSIQIPDPLNAAGQTQVNLFLNAGDSTINGAEFEGGYQVTDGFKLDATLGYVDSEINSGRSTVFNEVFGTQEIGGQKAERFPKWSGSLSGSLNGQVSSTMDWFARADILYTGERYADELNLLKADAGSRINVRGGIETDGYRVELYVTNLTNDETPTAINRFRDLSFATPLFDFSTFGYEVGLRDKRQVGVRVKASF